MFSQSPVPAVNGPVSKDNGGFTTGWNLGTRFEGSYSGDGGVYDSGSGGPTKNRKNFTSASVSTGAADLVRNNGYNAGIDFKPVYYLDLEFDYSRSVPLQLNSYSFGIGVDLSSLVRRRAH